MTRYVAADSSLFPYSAVAYIEATFSDGSRVSGTGTLVGRNDVLTAAHVIYDVDLGAAVNVTVELGRDGASRPYGTYEAFSLDYYELNNQTPGFFTQAESEFDLALVTLADAVGDDIGWFALGDVMTGQTYRVTGYPGLYRESSGPRLMEDLGFSSSMNGFDLVSLSDFEINPGNSGGPVWYQSPEGPVVVGAVSTDQWGAEVSAHYDVLSTWMQANDYLLPSLPRGFVETPFGIVSAVTAVDEFATLIESAGWHFPDALYEELQSRDELLRYPTLESSIDPVIRLYTGMLGRLPEREGVEYWVSQLNAGNGLKELAAAFAISNEFTQLADSLGGGVSGSLEALYQSVLGRSADAAGQAYWQSALAVGQVDFADVVLAFTNSQEYGLSSYSLVQGAKLLLWGVDLNLLDPADLGFSGLSTTEAMHAGALVRLYSGVLERAPDVQGMDYWLEMLASGQSLDHVADAFLAGNEFLGNQADTSNDALVESLYRQVLGRDADEEGRSFWLAQLAREEFEAGDLVLAFTESEEYQASRQSDVQTFLSNYRPVEVMGMSLDTETYLLG
ncbi:DUF4214 domain-containing protein [Vreelandella stevensii]|uniref:DUF4214 domain-containing protein n=1 Tax=Vreelandella stevensii TaxID=502821 RepID=UPI003749A4F5